jgi:CHAT domain-containing protein/Tfp pilus assembly protein PilF
MQQALVVARETKNPNQEGSALLILVSIQASMGRYETAIELNESALKLTGQTKDRILEARVLLQRSNLFALLNRIDKAIDYAEQALKINRETKYLNGLGDALSTLGGVHTKQGHHDKALEYYEQSLSVRRELKDQEGVSLSLSNMAEIYVAQGQTEKAVRYYEEALQIGREIRLPTRQAAALAGIGDAYRKLGQFDKAAELLTQALTINRELGRRPNEASNLYYLALAERARGNLASARSNVEESLKLTESIRTELLSPDARASLLAEGQDAYRLHIDLLMRGNGAERSADAALAFQISERQRARSLLDLLAEARVDVRRGVDASVLERERELARRLNARAASQVQLLSHPHTTEQAAALKQEISQLETDYERAQAEIRRASPSYAALTQPQPLALKEIQQQLDPDTLLLEYSLGSERSYVWAVTGDSIRGFELVPEKKITEAAKGLYNLMTARSRSEKGETAQQKQQRVRQAEEQLTQGAGSLSSMVLDPVAPLLANKRLVIVADGALQYIPFAMLPEPEKGRQGEGETGRRGEAEMERNRSSRPGATSPRLALGSTPLIVKHEIVSLASASILAEQRKEFANRKAAPRMIAVIADPVFSTTDERLSANSSSQTSATAQAQAASDESARIIEHLSDDSAFGGSGTLRIPRLPFTRREADQIMAIAPGNANFEALGLKANRATVTSGELAEYRYLHFATHGVLDSERPGLSALVLSMVDAEGKQQDGFLRANDIYNLKLPAELVVLSACQTGLGKEIKGEGLVGLTRGFMYAGSARVVVSLWSVNDKATADLMTRFYKKMLKQRERPAAALRAAQVEMLKQKQWQSPYYWAAFTMQGEWR